MDVRKIGRRLWLGRSAGGLFAVFAALDFGRGKEGWGILLGSTPNRVANAQQQDTMTAPQVLRVEAEIEMPNAQPGQPKPDVSAFVLVRGQEIAIVDTLTPGNARQIGNAIQSFGLNWGNVQHVIFTHYHSDHTGSAAAVADLAQAATLYAGPPDIPRITVPREIKPAWEGDEIFGLHILATPGHTPGHISVHEPASATLFAGDAAFNFNSQLSHAIPQFTADLAQATESFKKLSQLAFERALFAHGPPLVSGASGTFAALAATL
jgi:glyoxylase-like metal-dependent hydrolase (beta-lactamase superfamily II)